MEYKVTYTNGNASETHATLADAFRSLLARFPDLSAYTDDGCRVNEEAPEWHAVERIIVWENEDDSEEDDGARAVASISRVFE